MDDLVTATLGTGMTHRRESQNTLRVTANRGSWGGNTDLRARVLRVDVLA
jgi:hypothetical protein